MDVFSEKNEEKILFCMQSEFVIKVYVKKPTSGLDSLFLARIRSWKHHYSIKRIWFTYQNFWLRIFIFNKNHFILKEVHGWSGTVLQYLQLL